MEISSRERGGTRSRTCYSTATKPRIGKSTKRLSRNSVRRISLVGKQKRRSPVVGLGLYCLRRIFRVRGSFRQVSYHCGFLKSRGRLIVVSHPDFHLTSRQLFSAPSGHSETSSLFPSSMVSGGSGCVSGSHSRSTGVGLGGDVQRTPSGKVRQRSKSQMRRSEDGRSEEQGGGAGSGSTAH